MTPEEVNELQEKYILEVEMCKCAIKELSVYEKAFKLSCEELGEFSCMGDISKHKCDSDCATHWFNYFLQKAREE